MIDVIKFVKFTRNILMFLKGIPHLNIIHVLVKFRNLCNGKRTGQRDLIRGPKDRINKPDIFGKEAERLMGAALYTYIIRVIDQQLLISTNYKYLPLQVFI